MFKKISLLLLFCFLALPITALAGLHAYPGVDLSVQSIVDSATNLTGLIFGTIVVICFVVIGVLFMTAQGDPAKLKLARSALIWGLAGVAVGIIAWGAITLVSSIL